MLENKFPYLKQKKTMTKKLNHYVGMYICQV